NVTVVGPRYCWQPSGRCPLDLRGPQNGQVSRRRGSPHQRQGGGVLTRQPPHSGPRRGAEPGPLRRRRPLGGRLLFQFSFLRRLTLIGSHSTYLFRQACCPAWMTIQPSHYSISLSRVVAPRIASESRVPGDPRRVAAGVLRPRIAPARSAQTSP